MARITRYDESAPRFSGLPSSRAISGAPMGQSPSIDFTGGGVLSRIRERHMQQREQEAQQRAAERGLVAQTQDGTATERVSAPDNWASRYQQQFQRKARLVQENQLSLDAERTRFQLAQDHERDPDGYARAWDAYMQGVVGELEEQDPASAAQAQMALDELGLQEVQRRTEAKSVWEERQQLAEFEDGLRQRAAVYSDELLNSGDEEVYYDSLNALQRTFDDSVDAGLVDPVKGRAAFQQQRSRLTEEYVRGTFGQSLAQQDVGGAQGVVDALRRGKWFDDNVEARTLADRLERELANAMGGSGDGAGLAIRRIRQAVGAMETGQDVGEETVQDIFDQGMLAATTEQQRDDLMRGLRQYQIERAVGQEIEDVSITDLGAYREFVEGETWNLSPEARRSFLNRIDKTETDIVEAVNEGDVSRLGGDFAFNDPRYESPQEFRAAAQQQRERAARRAGVDPRAVPPLSRQQRRDAIESYNRAVEEGDPERATAVYERLFAPTETPWERAGLAKLMGKDSAAMGAVGMVAAEGLVSDARDLMRFNVTGQGLDANTLPNVDSARLQRFLERGDMREVRRAITLGDPDMADSAHSLVESVTLGVAAEMEQRGGSWGDVQSEVERLFSPLRDVTELANGYRVPRSLLAGHPQGADAVVDEINSVLNDPTRLGLSLSQSGNREHISIMPMGEDTIGFVDQRTGQFLLDASSESGEFLLINPPDIVEQSFPDGPPEGTMERINRETNTMMETSRVGGLALRLGQASGVMGSDPVFTESLALTAAQTPPTGTDLRVGGEYALPADIGDRVDVEALRGRVQSWLQGGEDIEGVRRPGAAQGSRMLDSLPDMEIDSQTLAPFAFAEYTNQLREKYPSEELAVAAFWAGEEVVDSALQEAGEEGAIDMLDGETQKFLGRWRARTQEGRAPQGAVRAPAREMVERDLQSELETQAGRLLQLREVRESALQIFRDILPRRTEDRVRDDLLRIRGDDTMRADESGADDG